MSWRWLWWAIFVIWMTGLPDVAVAKHKQVESLRWLQGVVVTVDLNLSSEVARRFVLRDSIQRHVELRLKNSGIRVLDASALATRSEELAVFEVEVTATDIPESQLIVVEMTLDMRQKLCRAVTGKPTQSVIATTWDEGGVALRPQALLKEDGVTGILDKFLDDFTGGWLEVHSK